MLTISMQQTSYKPTKNEAALNLVNNENMKFCAHFLFILQLFKTLEIRTTYSTSFESFRDSEVTEYRSLFLFFSGRN